MSMLAPSVGFAGIRFPTLREKFVNGAATAVAKGDVMQLDLALDTVAVTGVRGMHDADPGRLGTRFSPFSVVKDTEAFSPLFAGKLTYPVVIAAETIESGKAGYFYLSGHQIPCRLSVVLGEVPQLGTPLCTDHQVAGNRAARWMRNTNTAPLGGYARFFGWCNNTVAAGEMGSITFDGTMMGIIGEGN